MFDFSLRESPVSFENSFYCTILKHIFITKNTELYKLKLDDEKKNKHFYIYKQIYLIRFIFTLFICSFILICMTCS